MTDMPFIDYLNAVDEILETEYGLTSKQEDMDEIAGCQDEMLTPHEAATLLNSLRRTTDENRL